MPNPLWEILDKDEVIMLLESRTTMLRHLRDEHDALKLSYQRVCERLISIETWKGSPEEVKKMARAVFDEGVVPW